MESQEPHDLRENDLQHFMENLGEFWNRWGNPILIAVTIALVIFAGLRLYWSQQRQARESAWRDLATTSSPDAYVQVAGSHSIPAVKAIAQLRAGDLYLNEARGSQRSDKEPTQGQGPDKNTSQTDNADAQQTPQSQGEQSQGDTQRSYKQALNYAEESYQAVLGLNPDAIYRINARLGLAAVAESRENWKEARQQYEKVIELAKPDYPTSVGQAQSRLTMLPRLEHPTPLGSEPESAKSGNGPKQANPKSTSKSAAAKSKTPKQTNQPSDQSAKSNASDQSNASSQSNESSQSNFSKASESPESKPDESTTDESTPGESKPRAESDQSEANQTPSPPKAQDEPSGSK